MPITPAGLAAAMTTAQGTAPSAEGAAIQTAENLKMATGIVTYLLANILLSGSAVVASGSSAGTWPVTGVIT